MVKKLIYTLIVIAIAFFSFNLSYNKVYAEDDGSASGSGVFGTFNPETYNPGGFGATGSPTTASDADKIKDIGNTIVGILQVIGSIISVAMLAVLGIKYMVGSVEERAEYKKTMLPYLIGAIMLFAIVTLLSIIANIASGLF